MVKNKTTEVSYHCYTYPDWKHHFYPIYGTNQLSFPNMKPKKEGSYVVPIQIIIRLSRKKGYKKTNRR